MFKGIFNSLADAIMTSLISELAGKVSLSSPACANANDDSL